MEQKPITVFAKWQVKAEHLDTVLNLFTELVNKTRQEEGNMLYTVHQSNSEPATFMLYEIYKDEAAVAAHRASDHFKAIAIEQIIPVLENREVILATQIL